MATSITDIAGAGPVPYPSQAPGEVSTCDAAQILFGPWLYPHYIGWQSSVLGYGGAQFPGPQALRSELFNARRNEILGDLPSVLHYKHFMCYMIQTSSQILFHDYLQEDQHQASGQLSQRLWTPFLCGHRPHPGNKLRVSFMCSRCLIRHNHDTLKRIDAARRLYEDEDEDEDGLRFRKPSWRLCSKIWSYQKTQWRGIVDALEIEAVYEAMWETERFNKGLNIEQAVAGTIRSSEVLKEALTCPYMQDGWTLKFTPKARRDVKARRSTSPLRLDVACADRGSSSSTAGFCSGTRYARLDTHKNNVAGCPCISCLLYGGFSAEPADRSSSLDTLTPWPPRASLVISQVMRTRIWWAEDVVGHVRTRQTRQYLRRSPYYKPGTWACREGYEREHPSLVHDASDECDFDDDPVDDKDSVHEDSDDTNPEVLALMYPNPESPALQHLLAEAQTPQGPTMMQKVAAEDSIFADTNPLAAYDEARIKRRRLNDEMSAFLVEDWQAEEAKGEAARHDRIRKNHAQGLFLKGNPSTVPEGTEFNDIGDRAGGRAKDKKGIFVNTDSLAAHDETRVERHCSSNEDPEELSEMQKGAWDGEINVNDRTELKNYVRNLSLEDESETGEDGVIDSDVEEDATRCLKEVTKNCWRSRRSVVKGDAFKKL